MIDKDAHCVQCFQPLEYQVDDKSIVNALFVCVNPACSNYGLLAICQESMPKATK